MHRLPERNPFEIVIATFIAVQNAPGALGLVELPASIEQSLPYSLGRLLLLTFFTGGALTVFANTVPRRRELLRPWRRSDTPRPSGISPWVAIVEQAGLYTTAIGCIIYVPVLFHTSGYGALTATSFIVGYPVAAVMVAVKIQKAINSYGRPGGTR